MSSISCLLFDDEEIARLRLRKMLSTFSEIHILDEAENGIIALEKIEKLNPDFIFLDIQMPGMTGFELLAKLKKQPIIIFTTAFDDYAIQALEENAIAYLLKPIHEEKLAKAIKKTKMLLEEANGQNYEKLLSLIDRKDFTQFVSKIGAKIKFIPKEEVVFILAKDKHSFVHLLDSSEYIIDQTIAELETLLDSSFLRIHRGIIISSNYLSAAEKVGDGKYLFTLKDKEKSQVQSSASYSSQIREKLGF